MLLFSPQFTPLLVSTTLTNPNFPQLTFEYFSVLLLFYIFAVLNPVYATIAPAFLISLRPVDVLLVSLKHFLEKGK